MKYALLAYDRDHTLEALPSQEKRALHRGHAALHNQTSAATDVTVVAHYRCGASAHAMTVRIEAGRMSKSPAPEGANGTLRALYLVEGDYLDAVAALAVELPAVAAGAAVEIWPLTEPTSHSPST